MLEINEKRNIRNGWGGAVVIVVGALHPVARPVEEDEQHRIEHRHPDVQLDQGGEAVNGFPEVDGFGVEIDFRFWRRVAS